MALVFWSFCCSISNDVGSGRLGSSLNHAAVSTLLHYTLGKLVVCCVGNGELGI